MQAAFTIPDRIPSLAAVQDRLAAAFPDLPPSLLPSLSGFIQGELYRDTPEWKDHAAKLEQAEREEAAAYQVRARARMREELARPSLILVAWVRQVTPVGFPYFKAVWIPETGPRRAWVDSTNYYHPEPKDLTPHELFRWSRGKIKASFLDDFKTAYQQAGGPGFEAIAMHLLDDGPDRRAAYLARRAAAGITAPNQAREE